MPFLKLRKFQALTLLLCVLTFTMVLFNYTLRDPSGSGYLFLKYAVRLSDSLFPRGPCGCGAGRCLAEVTEDDSWFAERFNQSFHPVMSRKGSLLSEDTYRWWQWLQAERQPANYSEVIDRLFQVIPDKELYLDSGPERCRTCAVVGNSGNLKGSHYGPLIDASDFIIRMNQARTEGFEKDVGYRTTHHIMYPESAVDLDNGTCLVLVPFKTLDLEWLISALTTGTIQYTYLPVMAHIKASRDKAMVYSPSFFKYVYDIWLDGHGRYPSTGFLALMFAIHICDEVNVFGFGADQYGNWHHYWENNLVGGAFRQTGVHDGDYEYNVTQLLADKHKIKLFKGS